MSRLLSISSSETQDDAASGVRSGRRRLALAARGRRAVAWASVLFVLASMAGGLLVDLCPLRFRFPQAAFVMAHASTGAQSPTVVLMGSSRFGIGINTDRFSASLKKYSGDDRLSGYNAAIPAGDAITFNFVLTHLLEIKCHPRIAVIEISPETVNRYVPWMKFQILRQMTRMDIIKSIPDAAKSRAMDRVFTSLFFPLFRHNVQLTDWLFTDVAEAITGRPDAGMPWVFPNPKEQMGQSNETDYFKWFKRYKVAGIQPRKFEELLGLCRSNNIQPVLVGIPVSSHHRAFYTPTVEKQYMEFVVRLQREYGCAFVDYAGRLPDTMFADHHHLNEAGNEFFSDLLAGDVVRILNLHGTNEPQQTFDNPAH
ncbi:MAG: DUF1574 family protein [Phycisphaerales bacterium]|jgi:hypothetical protein|nr:DUF1574 family protein [Phycisphaerales bacterium]